MKRLVGAALAAVAFAWAGSAAAASSVDQFLVTSGAVDIITNPPATNDVCRGESAYCWGIGGARLESIKTFKLNVPGSDNQWAYIRLDARNSGSGFDETFYVGFTVEGVDYKTYFTAPADYPSFEVRIAAIGVSQAPGLGRWIIGSDGPYGPVIDRIILERGLVPEPATWAMMIIGFGAVGSMVRTSRRRNAFSAA